MAYLTDLAAACRKSGLRVVELPGWQHRGRPGRFNPKGILCHHTGSAGGGRSYVEWMAYTGRSDLPAPLCQLALERDGTVYVCAAGRANHAGKNRSVAGLLYGDGNRKLLGIEALNSGSEGWASRGTDAAGRTITQREAYVRLCAALNAHYGWQVRRTLGHRETSVTGKWDPGLLDMDELREDVATTMKGDEDVAYLDWPKKDRDALAEDVAQAVMVGWRIDGLGGKAGKWKGARRRERNVQSMLRGIYNALGAGKEG